MLETDQIGKSFGGLPAVDGVSIGADDGEILAIVGPNGAGKSTLLKVIVGLESATQGRVTFAGEDITKAPPYRVRQMGIAMVQQTPRPFPTMTVLENAALGALFGRPDGYRSEQDALRFGRNALSFVGLAERESDEVASLNLHEQRFLELARALAGQPRILILDEVMAGLNETELEASMQMVRSIRDSHDVTVIWVEHVMKAVMSLADRVVVLNFGKVLTEGTPQEVMRDPGVVEAYLGERSQHA